MNLKNTIYLDYAATTPVDERVLSVMIPYFLENYGNPSSIHFYGQQAEAALEDAREVVAQSINARPEEIVFTSCGTESDNLALRGAVLAEKKRRGANRIITTPVEHHAVLHTSHQLADEYGFELDILPVDSFGRVDPNDVKARLSGNAAIVSVIYANNEIGTINPIKEIGLFCRQAGVPFHTDAVQAAAHLEMNIERDFVDLLSIGAHKMYGPKGVGALYVRRDLPIIPAQTGGGQEGGKRAGTQNIPYIVGLAEAIRLSQKEYAPRSEAVIKLRDRLIATVLDKIPRSRLTGHPVDRLPNHASFVFEGVDGNALLMMLDAAGFACSSGSACKVGDPKPSDVLLAIGLTRPWAMGSLRVTLGKQTTEEEIDRFTKILPEIVDKIRKS